MLIDKGDMTLITDKMTKALDLKKDPAWREGYRAARANMPVTACRYQKESVNHWLWCNGHYGYMHGTRI